MTLLPSVYLAGREFWTAFDPFENPSFKQGNCQHRTCFLLTPSQSLYGYPMMYNDL